MDYQKNFYEIKNNSQIFEKILNEVDNVGYFKLPYQDTARIKEYAKSISQTHIVVIGVGGSSLGAKSIYDFLHPTQRFKKTLIFLETVDPLKVNYCLSRVDLNNCHFVVISKSGDTIETISLVKYLSKLVNLNKHNTTVISGRDSNLSSFAKKNNMETFFIEDNIGGRFSVFSVVGLIPLSMVGVDIDNLLNGCKRVYESYFAKRGYYSHIMNKARFLVENKSRFNINTIFSYSSSLESFNKWFIQLWAESLGKININGTRQSLTPVALVGPIDQHSFLQLIIDGVRDKTVTFIKIDDLKDDSVVPFSKNGEFDDFNLEYIEGISFNKLLNYQADSTIESVYDQKDIPCDVITIRTVDEYNIAKLMFSFQLIVSVIGQFLQINTYDQPGVEHGKKILKQDLKSKNVKNS